MEVTVVHRDKIPLDQKNPIISLRSVQPPSASSASSASSHGVHGDLSSFSVSSGSEEKLLRVEFDRLQTSVGGRDPET